MTSGVVLLDPDLRVRDESDAAGRALLRLLPPDEEVPPVPAIAFNVGAALLAGEHQTEGAGPETRAWTRVHLGGGYWMTARAERLSDGLVVSISPCTPRERVDVFARSHAMSPREVDVLDLVLRGLDARQIAVHLTIARTTAEDHLRALLAKTGSASRQHLVLRALGATPVQPPDHPH
jgi:DNA-binding CsgD family transcriptional regulator